MPRSISPSPRSRDATAGFARTGDGSFDTTQPTGWASQPGAIRSFTTKFNGANASNGSVSLYKLYSATNLLDSSGGNPSNDLPPSGWWNNGALFVDLNSPVSNTVLQTNVYPIMDPLPRHDQPRHGVANPTNVDGFSIDTTASCYYSNNPAAMPVRWLYVLRDGTITVPSSTNTTGAVFASNAPSSNNPIVGRIAFWTDDETCKLEHQHRQ